MSDSFSPLGGSGSGSDGSDGTSASGGESDDISRQMATWAEHPDQWLFYEEVFRTPTRAENICLIVMGSNNFFSSSWRDILSHICTTFSNLIFLDIGSSHHLGRSDEDNNILDVVAQSLTRLRHLCIGKENDIGCGGAEKIATMSFLQSLDIGLDNNITENGILALYRLQDLRRLRIDHFGNGISLPLSTETDISRPQSLCCLYRGDRCYKRDVNRFCNCSSFFFCRRSIYLLVVENRQEEDRVDENEELNIE